LLRSGAGAAGLLAYSPECLLMRAASNKLDVEAVCLRSLA